MRGYFREGRLWTENFLEKAERGGPEVVDDARAKALLGAGMLSFGYGDLLGSTRFLEEGLAAYRGLRNEAGTAATVAMLGYVRRAQGDDDRAQELSEEGLRLSKYLRDNRSAAIALSTLGHVACHRGDLARAADLFGEALAL